MTHRAKTLLIAMIAVAAVSAANALTAHAAPEFHSHDASTVLAIGQDGPGTATDKTGHQVFDVGGNGAITCRQLVASATTSAETTTQATVENISYSTCTFLGSPATVSMNGCHYLLTASGGGTKNSMETGQVHVQCPAGKSISFGIATCTVTVQPQTPTGPTNSITFHNIGATAEGTTQVTVEPTVSGIHLSASGAGCVKTGSFTGEYTTGNAIVAGEEDPSSSEVPIWWS